MRTTKWQIAGWMDGWRAEWRTVKMMDQRMDVREDRLTHQMKDEWSLMAGCGGTLTHWQTNRDLLYTHRCTQNAIIPSFYLQWLFAKINAVDVLWQAMVFDLIRKTHILRSNSLILLWERPCALWVVHMLSRGYVTCPAAGVKIQFAKMQN